MRNLSFTELKVVREALFEKCRAVMDKKNADYAPGSDPFKNFRSSSALGIDPKAGILIRMQDKLSRLATFVETGQLAAESVDDALIDIINYAALFHGMLTEERQDIILHPEDHQPVWERVKVTTTDRTGVTIDLDPEITANLRTAQPDDDRSRH